MGDEKDTCEAGQIRVVWGNCGTFLDEDGNDIAVWETNQMPTVNTVPIACKFYE